MTSLAGKAGEPASVYFLTLGCPKNEVDTDRMVARIARSPHAVVADPEQADTVVLNTCGFMEDAVSESIDNALDLAAWRDSAPGRRLLVVGCMVSRYGTDLETELSEADAFLSVADEHRIADILDEMTGVEVIAESAAELSALRTVGGHSAYVQVADGCFRDCSFCTIPAIRGPYRSRPVDDLVDETRLLVEGGAREIVLIGQDITAWGRELGDGRALPDLVRDVAALEGVEWLRLMYVQPDGISDRLLEVMAESPNVVEYLDLPLQHSSASVLRAMHRSGSAEAFLSLLDRIRAAVPDIALRTTLIAGFPGETPDDHEQLVEFVHDAKFDYAGVFPYSPEEGTPAATLPGLPDAEERLARAQRVRDAADEVSLARLARHVGRTSQVMVDGVDEDGVAVGRLRVQAPEVDGLVFLDRNVEPGTICDARITSTLGYDLEGEVTGC
jgi:ribosomal protein S12 methylthiotransferase